MNIFIYEFLSGGGLYLDPDDHHANHECVTQQSRLAIQSLAREGVAMLDAVTDDFIEVGSIVVVCLYDSRVWRPEAKKNVRCVEVDSRESVERQLAEFSQECDHTLVIAPEIDHHLFRIVRDLESSGVSLLGPSALFTELASDKLKSFQLWTADDCPTIETREVVECAEAVNWFEQGKQVVLKPQFGAGSCGTSLHASSETLRNGLVSAKRGNVPMVIQPFHDGLPVSVAAIGSGNSWRFLPACAQEFGNPLLYEGGCFPLAESLDRRAQEIAKLALGSFPLTNGYVGIDILLGQSDNGSDDKVVEINPRITTSYIGLRSACNENLAAAMLDAKLGKTSELTFQKNRLSFDTSGIVTRHE